MYVTYARKSWLNSAILRLWLNGVYKTYLADNGIDLGKALLFMDGCSAHDGEEASQAIADADVACEYLPPHCTPILQPLDQNVNKQLKAEYGKLWEAWYQEKGCNNFTRGGNQKRATDDEVNQWIAQALMTITPDVVRKCWQSTTDVINDPAHPRYQRVMVLPHTVWSRVTSFLGDTTVMLCNQQTKALQAVHLARYLTARRALYNGSRFSLPVSKKRKRHIVQQRNETVEEVMSNADEVMSDAEEEKMDAEREMDGEGVEEAHRRLVDARSEHVGDDDDDDEWPDDLPDLLLPPPPSIPTQSRLLQCSLMR